MNSDQERAGAVCVSALHASSFSVDQKKTLDKSIELVYANSNTLNEKRNRIMMKKIFAMPIGVLIALGLSLPAFPVTAFAVPSAEVSMYITDTTYAGDGRLHITQMSRTSS
ncbi:MAG: hypothetical protein LBN36_05860 [Clostridiales Family XIII bacterium]|nr:hypothetical protein [Clostridiales Family XIII bacterium]